MIDLRTRKLARIAVRYSVKAKPEEQVIISGGSESIPFLVELYKEIVLQGGHPIVRVNLPGINDFFFNHAKEQQITNFPQYWFDAVKKAKCYISVHTDENTRELSNCDPKKIAIRQKVLQPISYHINNEKTQIRRVVIAYPCLSHAQEADMSLNEYEHFVYNACLVDWKIIGKRLHKINSHFKKAKIVHLIGENVDLTMKINGKQSTVDDGLENMPGGEIFMAPVRESLNGWIKFEYPAIYCGKEVTGIYLKFQNGKVIEAKSDKNQDLLTTIIATDANSSYAGELGIGCNPNINKFTKNLLFDEKINGTIHLALGMAYKENGGGNDSAVHWDIVKDMHKAKIILDNKIIQDKGIWKI